MHRPSSLPVHKAPERCTFLQNPAETLIERLGRLDLLKGAKLLNPQAREALLPILTALDNPSLDGDGREFLLGMLGDELSTLDRRMPDPIEDGHYGKNIPDDARYDASDAEATAK